MTALVEHLEQQSTHNRLASYFNIDTLKYRVDRVVVVQLLLVLTTDSTSQWPPTATLVFHLTVPKVTPDGS